MKPVPANVLIEEEEGIPFTVIRVDVDSYEPYEAIDFVVDGYCKVILRRDKLITRTHYFKNRIETSKEQIIQDERIKSLNR